MSLPDFAPEFIIESALERSLDYSDLKVSKRSLVMSDYWDFSEEVSGSPRSIGKGRYTLEWNNYGFSSSLQAELKRIFGVYILSPNSFIFSKGAEIPGVSKVYSVMPRIKRALSFIAAVIDARFLKGACISSVTEIFPADLIAVAKTYLGRSC